MWPGWQLTILLMYVSFGEESNDFQDALSLGRRDPRLSLLVPTIIVRDLNVAPTDDDRKGPPTATNIAVRGAMHQLGFTDLTTGADGTPSYYPPQRRHPQVRHQHVLQGHEHFGRRRGNIRSLRDAGTGQQPLYIDHE